MTKPGFSMMTLLLTFESLKNVFVTDHLNILSYKKSDTIGVINRDLELIRNILLFIYVLKTIYEKLELILF